MEDKFIGDKRVDKVQKIIEASEMFTYEENWVPPNATELLAKRIVGALFYPDKVEHASKS